METAIVIALFAISALLIGRAMYRKAGFGDCGCGHCDDKRKRKA